MVVALLTSKREYRNLPVFYTYILWALIVDCAMMVLQANFPRLYRESYMAEVCLDSLLQYGILIELTWSVLRPFRSSLPRGTVAAISLAIALMAAVTWPFATIQGFSGLPAQWHFLVRIEQTFAILRVLFFIALAAGSQALSIGWRDRELQVASGLGIYSIASLFGSILHTRQSFGAQYVAVERFIALSYLLSLVYWIASFARESAPRRDFTPQMQGLLVAIAGVARSDRAGLGGIGPRNRNIP